MRVSVQNRQCNEKKVTAGSAGYSSTHVSLGEGRNNFIYEIFSFSLKNISSVHFTKRDFYS